MRFIYWKSTKSLPEEEDTKPSDKDFDDEAELNDKASLELFSVRGCINEENKDNMKINRILLNYFCFKYFSCIMTWTTNNISSWVYVMSQAVMYQRKRLKEYAKHKDSSTKHIDVK